MVPRHLPFWKFDSVNPTSPWFTRWCMKSYGWTFAKFRTIVHENINFDHGIVILSVFMAPDRVVLPASWNKSNRKLLACFLVDRFKYCRSTALYWGRTQWLAALDPSRVKTVSILIRTSFLGAASPWPVFHECKRRKGQICLFSFEDDVLLTRGSRPRCF